jgi:hypothetical protein
MNIEFPPDSESAIRKIDPQYPTTRTKLQK